MSTPLQDIFNSDTGVSAETVRDLLAQGADPDVSLFGESGITPLMWMADCLEINLFRLLAEFGADVNAHDAAGDGILSRMTRSDSVHGRVMNHRARSLPELEEIVDTLIAGGCDVDERDEEGLTPLMVAAAYPDKEYFADILIKRRASVHARDIRGNTPLVAACINLPWSRQDSWDRDVIPRLIAAGANPSETNMRGHTAMLAAIELGNYEAYEQLTQCGVSIETSPRLPQLDFFAACLRRNPARYEGEGLRRVINQRCSCGRTPLMWVAEAGDEETARWLLARGAEVDSRDKFGWTPLAFAVHRARAGMCALLLDSGADMNATFANVESPGSSYSSNYSGRV